MGIGVAPATHPLEVRLDGAGFQTVAAFENLQAVAANVGPRIMFEGVTNIDMASIQAGWQAGATNQTAYLAFSTWGGVTIAERMRIKAGGEVGIGATPVNKLDVEGAAVIGATYSGASTAPANGLLVEGNVGIGTASPTDKLDINSDTIRLRTAKTPASAADTCDGGEIAWDSSYVYVCVAANTWKRSAISTWP